jgi:hypothetical protein
MAIFICVFPFFSKLVIHAWQDVRVESSGVGGPIDMDR